MKNKNNKMEDIKNIFLEIKNELKEIRKENKEFSLSINNLYNRIILEAEKREHNEQQITELEKEVIELKKEKINILMRVHEINAKQNQIELELKENKDFQKQLKTNFWKGFWWIFGIIGSALGAIFTFFFSK